LTKQTSRGNFETDVLPHLDAAYNLARWLTRNGQDAEDIVQEACLRAFRFFGGFRGGDVRAWLLKIVRNAFYTRLQQDRSQESTTTFDEEIHSEGGGSVSPETFLLQSADGRLLRHALEELPANFREVLVLRELEGLSYKEIANVANIPVGTVMSSLSRARKRLRESLTALVNRHASAGPTAAIGTSM
jgi:RNA polymerase sigma-70 factor (ECF subfamily)